MPHRSEKPENQPYYEHNHADCPYNRNSRYEADNEKNYAEKNHNASFASTNFPYCRPPQVRRFNRDEDELGQNYLRRAASLPVTYSLRVVNLSHHSSQ